MLLRDMFALAPLKHQAERERIVQGFHVVIEAPIGSLRRGKNPNGFEWSMRMYHDYGYIKDTKGRDREEVDVFLGPDLFADEVYVVHMLDPNDSDEDKCFLGFPSAKAAKQAFLAHYPAELYEAMTVFPVARFRARIKQAAKPHCAKKLNASADAHRSFIPSSSYD